MERNYSVLIVDDEEGIRHGLKTFFNRRNFDVYTAEDFDAALNIARSNSLDAAIIDLKLKGSRTGIDLISELKNIEPEIVIVVITGYGSVDTAVTSMKIGAADYILKPIDNQKLYDIIIKNLELRNLKNENIYLKSELFTRYTPFDFITANKELKDIIARIDKIKNNPVTILIMGETGTGKEMLARYIHFTSNRRENQFVPINCAALSKELLLSELFGHEKGAFTGATSRKIGKFEIAHGGTLFLDEIGDMSPDVQAKLLRVIEEHSFERVGGVKKINVDVRIIAATNRDLNELIKEGQFREDLFYRINVFSFEIPPLKNRKEDIPLLIKHFINKYNKRYKKHIKDFDKDAYSAFISHNWPGNVRELENVINQAVLLTDKEIVTLENLIKSRIFVPYLIDYNEMEGFDPDSIKDLKSTIESITESYEKRILLHFLRKNNFNKSKTAKRLGITRKTLDAKIKNLGISDISGGDINKIEY